MPLTKESPINSEWLRNFPGEDYCVFIAKTYLLRKSEACNHCGHRSYQWKKTKQVLECNVCGTKRSITSHTIMTGSKLSIRTWFMALSALILQPDLTVEELKQILGLKRYQTAWKIATVLRKIIRIPNLKLPSRIDYEQMLCLDLDILFGKGMEGDFT